MDSFDLSELAAVSHQSLLFGSYPPQPSTKRQQTYPPAFTTPVYNSIEDWSAAELTSDSAPSPENGSPISPVFTGFSFPNSGEDWTSWEKIAGSPESDFFLKSEFLDSPDLTTIPVMSPSLGAADGTTRGLDEVVFGSEGVNDTRPLFQTPQLNLNNMPEQSQTVNTGVPTASGPSNTTQERRYPARNSLKRKSSDCSSTPSSPRSSCSPPPSQRRHTSASSKDDTSSSSNSSKPVLGPKKTAHNMIEKRYRTNLNDKIAALRDSVPALRVMVHRLEHADEGVDVMEEIKAEAGVEGDDDLTGLTPAHKLNKATILSKATEYIAHLERRNGALVKENAALRNRVDGFEMLVMSRSGQRSMWN